jgi:hypothetical protein
MQPTYTENKNLPRAFNGRALHSLQKTNWSLIGLSVVANGTERSCKRDQSLPCRICPRALVRNKLR